MTGATARFLAPADLEAPPVEFAHVGGNGKARESVVSFPLFATSNLGLLWQRFMPGRTIGLDTSAISGAPRPKEVTDAWGGSGIVKALSRHPAPPELRSLLGAAHDRRRAAVAALPGPSRWLCLRTRTRLALGLGLPSPVESSGMSLHHTYGVPVLSGSSLKGLARHFAEDELLADASRMLGGENGAALVDVGDGLCLWRDAGWLAPDVMTPHHIRYARGERQTAADVEDPVPISFVTVDAGVLFDVPLYARRAATQADVDQVRDWLAAALYWWGLGGRSGAGYGRFEEVACATT